MNRPPRLDHPAYLLTTPVWLQRGFLLAGLGASLAGTGWALQAWAAGRFAFEHGFALILCGLGLLILLRPATWRPWINFACDRRGIHLPWPDGDGFLFVPWQDVGETEVGLTSGMAGGGVRGVRIRLRLSKPDWDRLTGRRSRLYMKPDADGWGRINIGNSARDPERIRERIETMRPAPKGSQGR